VTIKDTGSLGWIDSGVTFPLFNHVFFTRLTIENMEKAINETLSHFRKRKLPMMWSVFPSSEPPGLRDQLLASGLKYHGNKPGMATNMSGLETRLTLPSGLRIDVVEGEGDLLSFVEVTARSFDVTEPDARAFFRILCSLKAGKPSRLVCYLGHLDNKPVATGVLFNAADVSGGYWMGTVPEARGRGVGTWMTKKVMMDGREMGYGVAVLQATEMGEPVYRRIGFRDHLSYGLFSYD
jgi:GNAT superfamily N-acetyltransferase